MTTVSLPLEGRTALVTGAVQGIGLAVARRLADDGAAVVLCDRPGSQVADVAAELAEQGHRTDARTFDVSDADAWQELERWFRDRDADLHILVNNAGVYDGGLLEETTLEAWRRVQSVNLDGVFLGTRTAIRLMKSAPLAGEVRHNIVNMSSAAGAGPFSASYRTSKAAIATFSKCAALECAALGYPIRVNSVHPGLTETAMQEQSIRNQSSSGAQDEDAYRERVRAAHPLGRFATPRDIAGAVRYLVDADADFVTGTTLYVDGGLTAG